MGPKSEAVGTGLEGRQMEGVGTGGYKCFWGGRAAMKVEEVCALVLPGVRTGPGEKSLRCLSTATGEKYVWCVRVGQLTLSSQMLLLQLGVRPFFGGGGA